MPTTKHKVKKNETLAEIARHYNVTVEALAAENSDRTHLLQPGHYIWIPMPPGPKGDGEETGVHADHGISANDETDASARLISRRSKILFSALGTIALVAIAFASYSWLCPRFPFPCRYGLERCRTVLSLFSETGAVVLHVVITLSVALGIWLLNRLDNPRRAFQLLSVILVVVPFIVVALSVTRYHHLQAARKAEEDSTSATRYASDQLARLERADAEATEVLKAAAKTNTQTAPSEMTEVRYTHQLIILDQAIARIVSYIHIIVRNEFPEFKLRAASLHMQVTSRNEDQRIWNIIQEGDQPKDAPFLPSDSLVGWTIKGAHRRYCPDVLQPDGWEDCKTYKLVSKGPAPRYRSLICFPLKGGNPQQVFAGLCFDSPIDRAFDRQEVELEQQVTQSMNDLTDLLIKYQTYEKDFFKIIKTPAVKP